MNKINRLTIVFLTIFSLLLFISSTSIVKAAALTEWNIPGTSPLPYDLTVDDSNNIWFTEHNNEKIGKFTLDGGFTEFKLPVGSRPWGIAWSKEDRKIWFTDEFADFIGQLSPDGKLKMFILPPEYNAGPRGITIQNKTFIWFTMYARGSIGLLYKSGDEFKIKEWRLPTRGGRSPGPIALTYAKDSGVWYLDYERDVIGNIASPSADSVLEWGLPSGSRPWDLSIDSLGRIWFTESGKNKIAVLNYPLNEIIEFEVPTSNSEPYGITVDASNKVWFTEHLTNKIGLFTPGINNFIEFERLSDGVPCFITTSKDGLEPIWYTVAWSKIGKIERRFGIATSFVTSISTASPSPITTAPLKAINASTLPFSSEERNIDRVETYTTSTSYIKTETSNVLFTSTTLTLTSTIIQATPSLTTETSTLYATKTIYVDTTTGVLTETVTTTVYSTTLILETTVATPIPAYSSKEILIGVLIGILTILALKSKLKNSSCKI
jgi:virginiamycin B lyase